MTPAFTNVGNKNAYDPFQFVQQAGGDDLTAIGGEQGFRDSLGNVDGKGIDLLSKDKGMGLEKMFSNSNPFAGGSDAMGGKLGEMALTAVFPQAKGYMMLLDLFGPMLKKIPIVGDLLNAPKKIFGGIGKAVGGVLKKL